MPIRNDKEKIINEIMNLRTMIGMMLTRDNEAQEAECQRQLNLIQDMVFGI